MQQYSSVSYKHLHIYCGPSVTWGWFGLNRQYLSCLPQGCGMRILTHIALGESGLCLISKLLFCI